MGNLSLLLFVVAAALAWHWTSGASFHAGQCPPKFKVHNNKPACFSDADCQKYGKICCPNQYNTKSCTDRAPYLKQYFKEKTGNCPLPSKVYGCSPTCVQDYNCSNGRLCCANACNAKSCSEPAPYGGSGGSGSSGSKYQTGSGIYCDNVKCSSGEVCKLDPKTKRNKCSRP